MRVMRVIASQMNIILCPLRDKWCVLRQFVSFSAFGEHECPWMTHELLMNYYYMEHYMGHYMCITCGVADKNLFGLRRTRISTNYTWITHELLFMKNSCLIHGHLRSVADKNSFVWDWKELARIRKNSAQELEINYL